MIARTTDVDDDGTGTTGTIRNNAWKQELYDQVDGRWSEATTTLTGTQNNLTFAEADTIRANNATALTLTGLTAPASPAKPGKPLRLVAIGAGTVALNDQDAGSTAANRIITGTGAALTLAAGTGWALLVYDGTSSRWRVIGSSASAAGGGAAVVQTTTSTGTQNDFALTAGATLLRANNASALTLTGLSAGSDGQRLEIVSIGAGAVTLNDQAAGSTAANRIITGTGGALTLPAGSGGVKLTYDATTARWRVNPVPPTGQIAFPAAQVASSDVNVLDDYEEGTWTPTIGGSGGQSGQVYSYQIGHYIKIGKLVIAFFDVGLSTLGTITTNVQIKGLPFASDTNTIAVANICWHATTTAYLFMLSSIAASDNAATILGMTAAGTTSLAVPIAQANLSATTIFRGTCMYRASA